MLANNPNADPPCFDLKFAFLVTPEIELRRLERTFEKLVARHDALRQSFERRGDEWFVNVWNRHRSGVIVEDHGDLSDPDFRALLQHHSSIRIGLLDEVLFQPLVLRCGRRGDVLFLRCHHGVVDGHSMIVLLEDWLKLLIGIPLVGQGITQEEYLSEDAKLSHRQIIDNQKYWNQLLFPALPNPGLGAFGKSGERPRIVYRTDTIRASTCSMTNAEFSEIPIAVNARSQTAFSIVFAAFADTIIELSELPGIYVSTNVDRRSNRLRNFVGYATAAPPIRCNAANGKSLGDYASVLASQLKESLAHLPSEAADYELEFDLAVHRSGGVLRHFDCSVASAHARVKRSPFSSGLLAAPETPQKLGPLTITQLRITNADFCFGGLELWITSDADRTHFEFLYHDHFYSEKDIETLRSAMQEKLRTRFV